MTADCLVHYKTCLNWIVNLFERHLSKWQPRDVVLALPWFPDLFDSRGANLSWSVFTYDGGDQRLWYTHATAWRHGAAGTQRTDRWWRHSVGRHQPFLLGSGAGWAARCLAFFRARAEAEALEWRERVGGQSRNCRTAAVSVALMVFPGFRAGAAGVWSQQDQSAVVFWADVRAVGASNGRAADWDFDLCGSKEATFVMLTQNNEYICIIL